ncbi:hypothetical protein [Emticicia sp. C21]|uniref:hypothetical protein n=1 Tax=Emticicia sp. C21 TaxID=2302915 RepID=UPI000E35552F|nr:hypothetical protein [Emticicia sp. C21]RFS17592.1 hypothetical protein D0T08_07430 [Emticicia sp. C21]
MQKTNELKSRINILAYYQIVGGAVGIIFLVWMIATTFPIQGLNILLYLFMAVFFGFSIYSGWLLVEKRIEIGLTLSKINQILQIFGVAFGGFAYEYVAGIALMPGIDLEDGANITFNFSLSKFELYFNSSKDFARVEFNLVAIYLVYFISKLQASIAIRKRLDV